MYNMARTFSRRLAHFQDIEIFKQNSAHLYFPTENFP